MVVHIERNTKTDTRCANLSFFVAHFTLDDRDPLLTVLNVHILGILLFVSYHIFLIADSGI